MKNYMIFITALLLPSIAYSTGLSDISSSNNIDAILYLNQKGIISGYPDGTFKPKNVINRAELLKILVGGQGVSVSVDEHNNCFPDVTTEWFAPYVCYAKQAGWIAGYPDGTFQPSRTVNKVEAIKMLVNSQGFDTSSSNQFYDDVDQNSWYAPYVNSAKEKNVIEENGTLGVTANMLREKISEYIYRSMYIKENNLDRFGEKQSQEPTKQTDEKCTGDDWNCLQFSSCMPEGKRYRECTLKNKDCIGSADVKPVTEDSCESEFPELSRMLDVVNHNRELLEEMDKTAKEVTPETGNRIYSIYNLFNKDFNEYVGIYNSAIEKPNSTHLYKYRYEPLELQFEAYEKQYRGIKLIFP